MAIMKRKAAIQGRIMNRKPTNRRQFKCLECAKQPACYGSRYCQRPFIPVSFIENY
jgi:hypothetical protein